MSTNTMNSSQSPEAGLSHPLLFEIEEREAGLAAYNRPYTRVDSVGERALDAPYAPYLGSVAIELSLFRPELDIDLAE